MAAKKKKAGCGTKKTTKKKTTKKTTKKKTTKKKK
jgi:hypothetical protein